MSFQSGEPPESNGRALNPECIHFVRRALDIPRPRGDNFLASLPFCADDTTAGSETELQAAVRGTREEVDLPQIIENSNYFANSIRRAAAGDTSSRPISKLERYLETNQSHVWENSWVRFERARLNSFACRIFEQDLLLDKSRPGYGQRTDCSRFLITVEGVEHIRVPVSYLLKLVLADAVGSSEEIPSLCRSTGVRLLNHFLNDNTSPETFSFHVPRLSAANGRGRAIAAETAKRYLLSEFLVMYANEKLGLRESGQEAMIYFSPHPPVRQRTLNDCISDAFYRELFMSPCLSGWDRGEAKHDYMCLCHSVLSRSQLNAVAKLRDANILPTNLVVLPNSSNISLANNGTHISLGSLKLTAALADSRSGVTHAHEKYVGDLVIKIVEHFLPLFVGMYSAAPYRLDYADFLPERVLGFLPHELDYTHLRMIWRRWRKKAGLSLFGQPIIPRGIGILDNTVSALFRLKGDIVPDFRLLDYLVTLPGTERSPALNGRVGNSEQLKKDLSDLGVFDVKMAVYMLYRLREYSVAGFSGFEGRYYSQFESFGEDMAQAANLQTLITALAFKLVLQGAITHSHIPDDPFTESERRQPFFVSAIDLPTFYVREDTRNMFLRRIISRTASMRCSRRYPGYLRIYNRQYRLALIDFIRSEGAGLVELLGMQDTVSDLVRRLEGRAGRSAAAKLERGILDHLGARSALAVGAGEFNTAAEDYYRRVLRGHHIAEAMDLAAADLRGLECHSVHEIRAAAWSIRRSAGGSESSTLLEQRRNEVLDRRIPLKELVCLINLLLLSFHWDAHCAGDNLQKDRYGDDGKHAASIHSAGLG
jgi:hypothetical protein